MCDEVGEKACGFREVLGGLVWDSEHEFELVFILDGLYKDGALIIPPPSERLGNSESACLLVVGPRPTGHP